ncbi:ABC transporter ATP-binding protein [Plantibacter sp. ME-Dv--P-122b]|uniref:ABC transporter ATP-binding protein n=1 Tax=Plantibacter sp. ME-Dv--P-122b TaxID=3040300 RepID=UPI00254B4C85|nr:ABC transporter ATP-binding protein [Plantibacter sp. ME-Dv--P-122b]
MIEATAVTVRAGTRTLLDGVSLTAATGTVTGIVGPNGSGKTTLLRALVRAVRVAGGRIVVDGHDLSTRRRRWIARRVAEVGQRIDPDPGLRVVDEVSLGGLAERGVLRGGGGALDEEVAAAIDTVGLTPRAFDRLATLSGGELQRVALARALAQRAPHVLLDEPTNHLDLRHRLEVVALLRTIAPTVVVVLHDLDLAAQACDHLVLLHHGRVAAAGPPREVLHPELIDRVYDVSTTRHDDPAGRVRFDFSLPPQRHHHPDTKEST